MPPTSGVYENADWEFSDNHPIFGPPISRGRTDFQDSPVVRLEEQNRSNKAEAVNVCSDFNCFSGIAVALPLSLLAWAFILTFLYLLFDHFH